MDKIKTTKQPKNTKRDKIAVFCQPRGDNPRGWFEVDQAWFFRFLDIAKTTDTPSNMIVYIAWRKY